MDFLSSFKGCSLLNKRYSSFWSTRLQLPSGSLRVYLNFPVFKLFTFLLKLWFGHWFVSLFLLTLKINSCSVISPKLRFLIVKGPNMRWTFSVLSRKYINRAIFRNLVQKLNFCLYAFLNVYQFCYFSEISYFFKYLMNILLSWFQVQVCNEDTLFYSSFLKQKRL